MDSGGPQLHKDPEDVVCKFERLIGLCNNLLEELRTSEPGTSNREWMAELRVSSINLLHRILPAGRNIYLDELHKMPLNGFDVHFFKGILLGALNDYREGFISNIKLLISGEVFVDLLVQAEVLLDSDYKDPAAVMIRAVLEDGLRKLCEVHHLETERRSGIGKLNDKLYKAQIYNMLEHKEIIAKSAIGNYAAHGKFDKYQKSDVMAFLEFAQRFLAQYLK
jgi:hypothetical protein